MPSESKLTAWGLTGLGPESTFSHKSVLNGNEREASLPAAGEKGQAGREAGWLGVKSSSHSGAAPRRWGGGGGQDGAPSPAPPPAPASARPPSAPRGAAVGCHDASARSPASAAAAPVSHRSGEEILGSDWLKFPRRLAIGCRCAGAARPSLWKVLWGAAVGGSWEGAGGGPAGFKQRSLCARLPHQVRGFSRPLEGNKRVLPVKANGCSGLLWGTEMQHVTSRSARF